MSGDNQMPDVMGRLFASAEAQRSCNPPLYEPLIISESEVPLVAEYVQKLMLKKEREFSCTWAARLKLGRVTLFERPVKVLR